MAAKTSTVASPKMSIDPGAEKLGCYRLWMRPKTSKKDARKRGHMLLGPYSLSLRK